MNKRKLHHKLKRLRAVPHWGLFVAGILLLFISVLALRANNQKMIELRAAVFAADEQDVDIEKALTELMEHVHRHMNTSLTAGDNDIRPPIQLKYRYERLVLQAQAARSTANMYTDAQNYCEQQISTGFSGSNRLQCIRDYIDRQGAAAIEVNIPNELYMFDFVSPNWSPDLAGLSLAAGVLCLAAFGLLLLSELLIKRNLKHHN